MCVWVPREGEEGQLEAAKSVVSPRVYIIRVVWKQTWVEVAAVGQPSLFPEHCRWELAVSSKRHGCFVILTREWVLALVRSASRERVGRSCPPPRCGSHVRGAVGGHHVPLLQHLVPALAAAVTAVGLVHAVMVVVLQDQILLGGVEVAELAVEHLQR